jgi:hypothetical protein
MQGDKIILLAQSGKLIHSVAAFGDSKTKTVCEEVLAGEKYGTKIWNGSIRRLTCEQCLTWEKEYYRKRRKPITVFPSESHS